MKRVILSVAVILLSACNKNNSDGYFYQLEKKNDSWTVGVNTVCYKNDGKFMQAKKCFKEERLTICIDNDGNETAIKNFKTKSVCESEVASEKRQAIELAQ
jgi:hypothetical protein